MPVETLKVALPLIANQDIAVVRKMIKFLQLVSAALSPLSLSLSSRAVLELELELSQSES